MKPYDFLYVIGDVADDLVSEAKEATMKEKSGRKPLRMILIGAAVVAVLTVGALAARYYTRSADMLEEKWNNSLGAETSMTEEQKNFIDDRSADLGESVTDGGVTITVDSVTATADTVYLNLTYQVEEGACEGEVQEVCALPTVYAKGQDWGHWSLIVLAAVFLRWRMASMWIRKLVCSGSFPREQGSRMEP